MTDHAINIPFLDADSRLTQTAIWKIGMDCVKIAFERREWNKCISICLDFLRVEGIRGMPPFTAALHFYAASCYDMMPPGTYGHSTGREDDVGRVVAHCYFGAKELESLMELEDYCQDMVDVVDDLQGLIRLHEELGGRVTQHQNTPLRSAGINKQQRIEEGRARAWKRVRFDPRPTMELAEAALQEF